MAKSNIGWTDQVLNVVTGCTRVSPGCGAGKIGGCYAEKMSSRLVAMNSEKYQGVAENGRWTGLVRTHPDELEKFYEKAIKWRTPRMVFVNSMSDTFHKDVPEDFIVEMFITLESIGESTGSIFQILTKRPDRMCEIVSRIQKEQPYGTELLNRHGWRYFWLGTSVEDQKTADERIPHLLRTPAAVRFLSCEPLLGELDICDYLDPVQHCINCDSTKTDSVTEQISYIPGEVDSITTYWCDDCGCREFYMRPEIPWVIVGCESVGHSTGRPMDLEWVRSIRDQCQSAKVALFVKQLGVGGKVVKDVSRFPEDLRIQEFPEAPNGQ